MVRIGIAALALGALLTGGCGGSSQPGAHAAAPSPAHARSGAARIQPQVPRTLPDPGPTATAPSAQDVAVIKGWSSALRAGNVRAAAAYFQLPSELINGVGANGQLGLIRIDTPAQAVAANETLPCGAVFVSAEQRGRYVNALFRLTGRGGPGGNSCGGGSNETARTNFVISAGHIVEWIRAPSDPGDNGGGGGSSSGSGGGPLV